MTRRNAFGTVTQLRNKRWTARYAVPRGQTYTDRDGTVRPATEGKRYSAGRAFPTKRAALAWLASVESDMLRRLWVPPDTPSTQPVEVPTLKAWSEEWLRRGETRAHKPLRRHTVYDYRRWLSRYVYPALGDARLDQITVADVNRWIAGVRPVNPKRNGDVLRRRVFELVRGIMRAAESEELIERAPFHSRSGPPVQRPARTVLPTPAELAIAVAAMPERERLAIHLAAVGGLRRGELCGLQRGDLHLTVTAPFVSVRRQDVGALTGHELTDPKTRAGQRDVFVAKELVPLIVAHLDRFVGGSDQAPLFTDAKGGALKPEALAGHWRAARRVAGLGPGQRAKGDPGVKLHSLRHLAATSLAVAGATTRQVLDQLGQASPGMLATYVEDAKAERAEVAGRAGAAYMAAVMGDTSVMPDTIPAVT
jgi:integrase